MSVETQSDFAIAKAIADHLHLSGGKLPRYLMDDKDKRTPLDEENERILAHYHEDSLWTLKTVRFLKDFSRFKAGVHMETNNKTFLRTAELFRQMGIKNYYFLLQINNPLLKDVDPWDPNLSDEIKAMVLQECQENVWYIVREVIKIDGRRFRANRAVISFIWSCLNHIPTLILMPRQSGKAMDVEEPIRTPTGWTTHGEVKIGDKILNKNGTEGTVIGVHPQGKLDGFEIEFQDGRKVVTCGEHQWTTWDPIKQVGGRKGSWETYTTAEMFERKLRLNRSDASLSIPLMDVDKTTPHKDLPIPPYLLGYLVVKGKVEKGKIVFPYVTPDECALISATLPKGLRVAASNDLRSGYMECDQGLEHLLDGFKALYGGVKRNSRRLPQEYLLGSYTQRVKLLNGLLDARGQVSSSGTPYFLSSNKGLCNDVQELCWSLGMIASLKEKKVKFGLPGKESESISYNVNIRCKDPTILFTGIKKLKLSGAEKTNARNNNDKLTIKTITPLHEKREMVCIEVDNKDELYITRNYIVTHNTVGMQVLAFIMQYLIGRGFKSGLITLAAPNRMQFVNAIKKIRSGLPEYMTEMTYMDKDAGNILTYQAFGEDKKNTFEIRVPNGGEDGADNIGRGATWEMMLVDEPAWMKYIENILNGAGPATLTAQKLARESGIPYFTAQATTPNSILKDEGRYMYDEMMKSTEWREAFFDSYSETHLVERVMKASPISTTAPRLVMQFNHLQLGFGKDWVRETMDKLRLSWSKAKIDLLMMWTEEGKNKLFDDKTRERLSDGKLEPIWNEEIGDTGLFVDWFVDQPTLKAIVNDPNEFLLYGVDTSDAVDKDACTLVIRRMRTGENVGIGRYPLAFLDDVTQVLKHLIVTIENSLLVIERNRAAHMIDQLLIALPALGIDPFKRIFNDIYQDPVKYKNEYRDTQDVSFKFRTKDFYLKHKKHFGFTTNARTRAEMYGYIFEAVNNTGKGARYSKLIDELIGLERDADGRIDHSTKGHDDLVIAWLLSYWFYKLGYNKALYGIPAGCMMTSVTLLAENPDEPHYGKEQMELFFHVKKRIEELSKELRDCDNGMIGQRIEMEMRELGKFLPKDLRKTITIDDVITEAQTERNKRAVNKRMGLYVRR